MFGKIMCKIFGHRFITIRKFKKSEQVYCTRCKTFYGMHHELKTIVEWDKDLENAYKDMDVIEREVSINGRIMKYVK